MKVHVLETVLFCCFLLQIYYEDGKKTARSDEAMHMGVCAEERDERERERERLKKAEEGVGVCDCR